MRDGRTRLVLGFLLGLLGLFCSPAATMLRVDAAPVDDDVERVVAEARAAVEAGTPERAIPLLRECARQDPGSCLPLFLEACRRAQRYAEGRAAIAQVAVPADGPAVATIAIAQWEAEDGWVVRAAQRLDAALEALPEEAALWEARARLARSTGDPATAEEAARRAIAAGADPDAVAWLRGEAAIELGRPDEGSAILRQLVDRQPGHLGARLSLARAALEGEDRATAIEECWQVLERSPDHVGALGTLGGVLVRDPAERARGLRLLERFRIGRDRRERIDRLTRERREGRDAPALRVELARLLRADGRPEPALAVASDLTGAEDPRTRAALLGEAGKALRSLGRSGAALRALGAAVASDRSRNDLRCEVAEILLEEGDVGRAGEVIDRLAGTVDPSREAWLVAEWFARRGAGWDELGPRLWAILGASPTDRSAMRAYVDAALALGRAPEVRAQLEPRAFGEVARGLGPRARDTARLGLAWLLSENDGEDALLTRLEEELAASDGVDAWLWIASRCRARGDVDGAEEAARRARRARAVDGPSPLPGG